MIETELGRPAPHGTAAIGVDGTVLAITGGLGVLIALALPLLPLLTPWRVRVADDLRRAGNTSTDGRSVRHLRSSLIAFEVAGTLILLIGCGLLLRSAAAMLGTDLGFDAGRLVRARIVLRASDYPDPSGFFRFYGQFTDRLAAVTNAPVVFSNWPPFFDLPTQSIEADGRAGQGVKGGVIRDRPGLLRRAGHTAQRRPRIHARRRRNRAARSPRQRDARPAPVARRIGAGPPGPRRPADRRRIDTGAVADGCGSRR